MADFMFYDWETRGPDLTKIGALNYVLDERTCIMLLTYRFDKGSTRSWLPDLSDLLSPEAWAMVQGMVDSHTDIPPEITEHIEAGGLTIAWNAAFDRHVWQQIATPFNGFPELKLVQTLDAMAQAQASNLPGKLDMAGRALKLGGKTQGGAAIMKLFADISQPVPEDRGKWETYLDYGVRDTDLMANIWYATRPLSYEEWRDYWVSERINDRGIGVDLDVCEGAVQYRAEEAAHVAAECVKLSNGQIAKPTLTQKINEWVYEWLPESLSQHMVAKRDEETGEVTNKTLGRKVIERIRGDIEVMDAPPADNVVQFLELLEFGRSSSAVKFEKMRDQSVDGRLCGSYVFSGAGQTGRFSSRGIQCVTGDHEVLTRDGWKRIDGCLGRIEIMQWASETGVMSWTRGTVMQYKPAGILYAVKSPGISGMFTCDHRLPNVLHKLIDWTPEKLLTVKRRGGFLVNAPVDQPPLRRTDDELRLLLAFQADGTWAKNAVVWHMSKPRKLKRIRELLTACGIPFVVHEYDQSTVTRIHTDDVPDWMTKDLWVWILHLDARQAQIVVDEVPEWDGWRHTQKGHTCISTGNPTDAEALVTLAALAGRMASIKKYRNNKGQDHWRVFFKSSKTTTILSDNVTVVEDNSPVYCPTVPGGYWLCRYQGKVFITGNCHNLPRDAMENELELLDMVARKEPIEAIRKYGPVSKTLSRLIRPTLIAGEGKVFVWGDWSAIEARVLPWLANTRSADRAVLQPYRNGEDLYILNAAAIFGVDVADLYDRLNSGDKAALFMRQAGKISTLSLQFGGSVGAYKAMARGYGMVVTNEEGKRIVDGWRANNGWARSYWSVVEKAMFDAMRNPGVRFTAGRLSYVYQKDLLAGSLMCFLPDGRPLMYPMAKIERIETSWGEKKKTITYHNGMGRRNMWAGIAVENSTQATAASLLRHTLMRLETEDFSADVILHTHDEILAECPEDRERETLDGLKIMMEDNPSWATDLPLKADMSADTYYHK